MSTAAFSARDHETFTNDGVVHLPRVIDTHDVVRLADAVDELIASPSKHGANVTPSGNAGMFFQDRHLFPHNAEFRSFLQDLPLARLAAEATGSNSIRAFYEQVFVKEPGTRENFVWHQDRPYWNVDGRQICSTWVALTPADVASSALEFVLGSHRWGVTYQPKFPGMEDKTPAELEETLWRGVGDYVESFEDECPDFEQYPDQYQVQGFAVEPGDVLLFDYRIVHRSGPNAGANRRAAISWRWLGDDAIWAPKLGADPIVRPRDTHLQPGELIDDDGVFPVAYRHRAAS